jgi:hypothetical protein
MQTAAPLFHNSKPAFQNAPLHRTLSEKASLFAPFGAVSIIAPPTKMAAGGFAPQTITVT